MPSSPLRPCTQPRCSNLVTSGRCQAHQTQHYTERERTRGNRIARGYDHAWLKLRAWFIRQPENAWCTSCRAAGRLRTTAEVDHIVPFRGLDDPRRLDPANLQGLCRDCHRKKTASQR